MCFLSWESMNFTFKKKKQRFRFSLVQPSEIHQPKWPHIDAVSAPGTTHTIHAGQVAIEEGSRTNGGCASGTCWRRQEPPKRVVIPSDFFLAIIFPIFPHINYGKVSCHGEDEAARNRMVEIGKIVAFFC